MRYQIDHSQTVTDNKLCIVQYGDSLALHFWFQGAECGLTFSQPTQTFHVQFEFEQTELKAKGFDMDSILSVTDQREFNICCNTQMILHQVVSTKYEGQYKEAFIESKSVELLLCTLYTLEEIKAPCENCKFLNQPLEKEKIMQAREIILRNIHQPPTIPELARMIGINQCYLKKGFKEMFKSTIYEFVIEQRMQRATLLLSLNNQSVSQIAEEIGYSNTSNFSNAFKKYTGRYPSEFVKN